MLAGISVALLISGGSWVATPAGASAAPASQPKSPAEPAAELTPASVALATLAADRPSKVTVPSEYIFDPKRGALHDYCTLAPDEFPAAHAVNADFRGPCARHDLCYAGSTSEKSCDTALRRDMYRNCEHYYSRYNPLRTGCKAVAVTYWAAVVAA